MTTDYGYFKYLLNLLVDKKYEKKLQIMSYDDNNKFKFSHIFNENKKRQSRLVYIDQENCSESIFFHENIKLNVTTNITSVDEIFNTLKKYASKCKIISFFSLSKKPAIVLQSTERTLYCLFNIKRLVLGVAKLEDEVAKVDKHGRFLAKWHPCSNRWRIPIIEILGGIIRKELKLMVPEDKYGIVISHDVDRIGIEPFFLIREMILNKNFMKIVLHYRQHYMHHSIRKLVNLNSQLGIRATWFLLSGKYSFRRYGNRYNSNTWKVKEIIKLLDAHEQAIGMHTSYYGAFAKGRVSEEMMNLEKVCDRPVKVNRNHYLRFDYRRSVPILDACGFKADATLGYSDANGFRSGLCRPFRPWNYETGKMSKLIEIPLFFMDSVHGEDLAESWNDVKRVLDWIDRVKGCGSVLFHPCFLAECENNQEFYVKFIQECRRMNIPLLSLGDVLIKTKD